MQEEHILVYKFYFREFVISCIMTELVYHDMRIKLKKVNINIVSELKNLNLQVTSLF